MQILEDSLAGTVDTPALSDVLRVLAALSDGNRFRIVELLSAEGVELSCGAIGTPLGLSPSLVSHHLSILESAKIIERRKDGLWTMNRLRRDALAGHLERVSRLVG